MPFLNSLQAETAGPISRKRTHAQITRSSSRSVTPPPSKRRRTSINQARVRSPSRQSPMPSGTSPFRFAGDGLDFRTPTTTAMEQSQEHNTIDLTQLSDADDDDTSIASSLPTSSHNSRRISARRRGARRVGTYSDRSASQRAPPFDQLPQPAPREIIDLSNIDNGGDEAIPRTEGRPVSLSSSPEVQIIGERPINRRPVLPSVANLVGAGEPPGLQRADAQTFETRSFGSTIQRLTTNLMRGFVGRTAGPHHATGVPQIHPNWATFGFLGREVPVPAPLDLEVYSEYGDDDDNIYLDYEIGGMGMADLRDQEVVHVTSDYKPPLPAREGFTRNIEDDDAENVLVCVGCEEVLTSGDEDIKQQVWVLKKCGHVYCGECASLRVFPRAGNNRDRKKAKQPKLDVYKMCRAEGCKEKITARTAMFQLYL